VEATTEVIAAADADILVLMDVDFDAGRAALDALADSLAAAGQPYPHRLALPPNSGRPTAVDLDGDGRTWRARDAVGFGYFTGDGGMALLSRHPIGTVRDFTAMPWVALPGATAAEVTPAEALPDLPLHTVGAWDVEILTPSGTLHVLVSDATPPVFDGPEDRNGLRNADELRFWADYLDGWSPQGAPFAATRFAIMANLEIDPARGEGRREALRALLDHPALRDPAPRAPGGGTATADWPEPQPGKLRVDYILPSRTLRVTGTGILWPEAGETLMGLDAETAATASDHRLVWVDVTLP
jgi:endonuclease/exonuclease/phosphatase family metal-dependent hydrolase